MGLGDQSRFRQRTQSLFFILSHYRDTLTRLSFSKEQQPQIDKSSDPQSVLDQDNINTNTNRSFSLSFRMFTFQKEEEPMPDSDKPKANTDINVGTSEECKTDVQIIVPTMDNKELEAAEKEEESDYEDGFMYAKSPSFNIYLRQSIRVCKDESKDSEKGEPSLAEDKSNETPSSDSNEVEKDSEKTTENSGRRFMKAKSRAIRRNFVLLQHALRCMRARFTLRKI